MSKNIRLNYFDNNYIISVFYGCERLIFRLLMQCILPLILHQCLFREKHVNTSRYDFEATPAQPYHHPFQRANVCPIPSLSPGYAPTPYQPQPSFIPPNSATRGETNPSLPSHVILGWNESRHEMAAETVQYCFSVTTQHYHVCCCERDGGCSPYMAVEEG